MTFPAGSKVEYAGGIYRVVVTCSAGWWLRQVESGEYVWVADVWSEVAA